MPNKCGVVNCKGNYNQKNKCRVFKLPKGESEKQEWLNVLPLRHNFVINSAKFFVCERHWPSNTPQVKLPGGFTRPAIPPSVFNVPTSCLPTPKPAPRKPKQEDEQLKCFLNKDVIHSFGYFLPDTNLQEKYDNLIISRTEDKFVCVFMSEDFQESLLSVIVYNISTMCSPLIMSAFKNGINVPLGKILNPNNGVKCYSQFFEAVHKAYSYNPRMDDVVNKVVSILQNQNSEFDDTKKAKKLKFITRQLQLLIHKTFSVEDISFAIESFPKCNYEQLRDFLVLPSKRMLQNVISSGNIEKDEQSSIITPHFLEDDCQTQNFSTEDTEDEHQNEIYSKKRKIEKLRNHCEIEKDISDVNDDDNNVISSVDIKTEKGISDANDDDFNNVISGVEIKMENDISDVDDDVNGAEIKIEKSFLDENYDKAFEDNFINFQSVEIVHDKIDLNIKSESNVFEDSPPHSAEPDLI